MLEAGTLITPVLFKKWFYSYHADLNGIST
jgi:hypothetical protein